MREILFKAKRIDNGEWVEGTPIFDYRDEQWRIIMELDYSTGTCITSDRAPRVIAKTICQYTGLTDKNGNKIWENDLVLDSEEGELYKMVWCHDSMRYCVEKTGGFDYEFDSSYAISLEVIGNVFDNADLLKE